MQYLGIWVEFPVITSQSISHQPSSPLTIEPIDLWSSFATFKPFGLFDFEKAQLISGVIEISET